MADRNRRQQPDPNDESALRGLTDEHVRGVGEDDEEFEDTEDADEEDEDEDEEGTS